MEVVDVTPTNAPPPPSRRRPHCKSWKLVSTHLEEAIWGQLLDTSRKCDEKAAQSRRRGRRRTVSDDVEKRALRADLLVQVGELSAAIQALESATLAPGDQATLDALTDATRRPPDLRTPLSPEVFGHAPRRHDNGTSQTVVGRTQSAQLVLLTKPDGGVRGIVAGDVVRRLVVRTPNRQRAPINTPCRRE